MTAAEGALEGLEAADCVLAGLESGVGARSWTGWSRAARMLSLESPRAGLGIWKRGGVGGSLSGELGGESRADRKLSSWKSGELVPLSWVESSKFSLDRVSVASVSEDGVDPATKLGSSALVSDGGEVPESLSLQESSLESLD